MFSVIKMTMLRRIITFLVTFGCAAVLIQGQFLECHDDPSYEPEEDTLDEITFSWLGVLQYIHVRNGTPHYFRVPRVILVTRQFVLSTAVDAAFVPEGYALGNVVIGDYERDEEECRISLTELAAGASCDPGILIMPIADVLLHPEFKHFGAKNSIALMKMLKPVKSFYTLPACLPFKDFITRKDKRQSTEKLYHVDYANDVPRNFIDEEKEMTKLSLLPRELCYLYDGDVENSTRFVKNRMACTTGCGMHSGAPSVIHEHTGHWTIVAIALGGPACMDPLRPRRPPTPPKHILLYPYVPWITAAIAGKAVGAFAKDDPFGFTMALQKPGEPNLHDILFHEWVGHWWYAGPRCHDRGEMAEDMFKFYHEIFQVIPEVETEAFVTYYLEIDAAQDTMIICVKVGMPYRIGVPTVRDLNQPTIRLKIPYMHFYSPYLLQVEAYAYNVSSSEMETSSTSSSSCSSDDEDCSQGQAKSN